MPYPPDIFFMPDAQQGQRLAVHHRAQGVARGAVLYVHPFAEEMNKSRRMAALQSRALAAAGFDVLQIDLLGCGDSSGDFGDATWAAWLRDVAAALDWLRQRQPLSVTLWGLRSGCLLAAQAAAHLDTRVDFVFWQPPASGKALLQQFLRLKAASQLQAGASQGLMQQLRAELAAGRAVDIAGYRVHPAMAEGLESAQLLAPPNARRVAWFELSSRADATLLPASASVVEQWRRAGVEVDARVLQGPAFWQTAETETAPALISATTACLALAEASVP